MAAFRTSRSFDILFVLALLAGLGWCALNRVAIGDDIFFLTHQPDTQTTQVAAAAGLSAAGTRLLERSDPQFVGQTEATRECDTERLGCLSPHGQAFILDDPAKPNQTVVTAAHEMLHLAYERLSAAKAAELAPLIDQAIAQNALQINSELDGQTTDADRRDEAHSLLGTEYKNLPPDLETYYATYFSDRSKVLAAAAAE